jgi:hypothetical protein
VHLGGDERSSINKEKRKRQKDVGTKQSLRSSKENIILVDAQVVWHRKGSGVAVCDMNGIYFLNATNATPGLVAWTTWY